MQQQQDNDNYSEQQRRKQKRHHANPLNLSYEQLKERLQTLKNYNIWKQTKAKRINYRQFQASQGPPIINTISSYGARYGKNEVFTDFLQNKNAEETKSAHKNRLESSSNMKIQKVASQSDKPSFLSYKTNEKQKEKIQRLVNKLPQDNCNNQVLKSKKRAITQTKLNEKSQIQKSNNNTYRKSSPIPKQLIILKNKLKILPSLDNRYKTEPTQINPQDENPTISIGSNSGNQVATIKTDHLPPKSSFTIRQQVAPDLIPRKRSNYFSCIRNILSKSYDLLNGLEGSHEQDIRMSNNSYKSAHASISRSQQELEYKTQSRSRYLSYWPVYGKYSISEKDRNKLDRIAKRCEQLNKHDGFGNEELGVMINLIKEQINVQQDKLNKEVLDEEKNAFSHKFDYKINLEKDKYKKNVKQLLKCKKQYRLQKQRQEIRANGIKRMKKMGQIDVKMKKLNMTKQENQNQ